MKENHEINAFKEVLKGFRYGYPLKTVFVIENNRVKVITAYPLKKERAR